MPLRQLGGTCDVRQKLRAIEPWQVKSDDGDKRLLASAKHVKSGVAVSGLTNGTAMRFEELSKRGLKRGFGVGNENANAYKGE